MSEKSIGENEEIRRNSPRVDRRSYLKTIGATGGGLAFGGLGLGETTIEPARAAPTVLDDFEDGDIDEYTGNTGNYTVEQSSELEGNYRLKCSDPYDQLASTSTHGRGYQYSYRFIAGSGSGSKPGLLTCVQDGSSPISACYWFHPDVSNDRLKLIRQGGDSDEELDAVSVSSGLSEGTEYRGVVELRSDTVKGILYDADGNQLAATSEVTDTTHSGGHYGFYTGAGQPAYYDYVTKESLGESSSPDSFVIDGFEDGDISEYDHDPEFDGEASVVSSPKYNGSHSLEISSENAELISTSGLDVYPSAGDTFSLWVRPSGGANNINVSWGVQNHDDRYYAKLKPERGSFYLFTYKGGSGSSQDSAGNLSLSQGEWYEVEIDWADGGSQIATLYNPDGTQLAQLSMSDSTWSSGGIGFDAYLSSGESAHFDYVTFPEATQLGVFENGYDGWSTTNSNSLSRVSYEQERAPVTQGENALEVTIDSDPEPTIQNESRIRGADLTGHPCLLADVLPTSVEGSDSAVTFRFRYHHTEPGGVEESHEMTVDQGYGGRICWDMDELSDTKLENPDRLEITWYPADHLPGSGFDYDGRVFVDNVRLTDDRNQVTRARCQMKQQELERAHGPMINQIIQSESDTTQEGVYQYEDGTEVSYQLEKLQNGNVEETCDGDTFTWEVSL
jgi:hypothetical protein